MKQTISLTKAIAAVVISVGLTAALCFGGFYFYQNSSKIFKISAKLAEIDALETKYYDGKIDYKELDAAILSGYVEGIKDNKYGFYKGPEDIDEVKGSMKGSFKGLGINVIEHPDNKTMYLVHVNKDSPADKASLLAGDEITEIDGQSVTQMGYDKAYESMQREVGKTIKLTVLRNGKTLSVTAEYGDYTVQSIYSRMIDGFGYIQITGFNAATVDQFKTAVTDLRNQGAQGLIFDLRNNGGGTVDSASKMLDLLVPKGNIISVKYANGKTEVLHTSDEGEVNLPMAVLVNENSASASELFAANIRDYGKGNLIGTKTYGKGVMQRTYYLKDNSSLRITVGKYYPKNGENFDGKGLMPDIEVKLDQQQTKYFYMLTDKQDPVKTAAVEYLKNLVK